MTFLAVVEIVKFVTFPMSFCEIGIDCKNCSFLMNLRYLSYLQA